jgi:hypothetical protein
MVWDGINLAWDCMEIDQIAQISGFQKKKKKKKKKKKPSCS